MNAEFQRTARRDKSFLNEQCKQQRKTTEWERLEISSGDIKRTFHARMGTIKDRNSKDLTEAEK